MESITIYVKDKEQIGILHQLLQYIDFVVMLVGFKQIAKTLNTFFSNQQDYGKTEILLRMIYAQEHGKRV